MGRWGGHTAAPRWTGARPVPLRAIGRPREFLRNVRSRRLTAQPAGAPRRRGFPSARSRFSTRPGRRLRRNPAVRRRRRPTIGAIWRDDGAGLHALREVLGDGDHERHLVRVGVGQHHDARCRAGRAASPTGCAAAFLSSPLTWRVTMLHPGDLDAVVSRRGRRRPSPPAPSVRRPPCASRFTSACSFSTTPTACVVGRVQRLEDAVERGVRCWTAETAPSPVTASMRRTPAATPPSATT